MNKLTSEDGGGGRRLQTLRQDIVLDSDWDAVKSRLWDVFSLQKGLVSSRIARRLTFDLLFSMRF